MGVGFAAPSHAQEARSEPVQSQADEQNQKRAVVDSPGMNEIVVTAQRIEQRLRDVPIAVSALGGERLAESGITNVLQMTDAVPSLTVVRNFGLVNLFIRGIGSNLINVGADNSVAFHVDGVYIGRQRAQVAAFMDVERVEVLRGPQGTLYGRNATGGAINVISRKPSDILQADARLTVGNYAFARFEGGIGGPIGQNLSARFAVMGARRDGFGKNLVTGRDIDDLREFGGRLSLKYEPSSTVELLLSADYYKADDHAFQFKYLRGARADVTPVAELLGSVPSDRRDVTTDIDAVRKTEIKGLTFTASWDATDALTFKSVSGYRKSDTFSGPYDADGGHPPRQVNVDHIEIAEQVSQELQGVWSSGRASIITGLYYYHEKLDGATPVRIFLFNPPRLGGSGPGQGTIDAYAAYGHFSYDVIDSIKLTAALRYSKEKRKSSGQAAGVPIAPVKKSWDSFTPRFAVEFRPNDDAMIYVSATKGFKSGFLQIGSLNPPVDPETIWSYEVGFKGDFFDKAVQLNAAYFHYDYSNMQVVRSLGTNTMNENAASSKIDGAEMEISSRLWQGARLDLSGTYLDTRFTEYLTNDVTQGPPPAQPPGFIPPLLDLSGNPLPFVSKWTLQVRGEQTVRLGDGELALHADYSWRSRQYLDAYKFRVRSQGSYGMLNGRISYQPDGLPWNIALWGRNLTNKTTIQSLQVAAGFTGYPLLGQLNEPRTYGIEFTFRR